MCREKHEGFPMYSIILYVPRKTRRFSNVQYHIVCAAKNTKVFQCTVSYCMCREKHEGFPMYSIILYVPRKTRRFSNIQYHIVCRFSNVYHIVCDTKNTKVFQCTVSYCMCREKHEGFPIYSIILYVPRKTRRFSTEQYHIVCAAKNTKVFQ